MSVRSCWLPVASAQLSKMLVTSDVSMTASSAGSSGVSTVEEDTGYKWCQHDGVQCRFQWCQHSWARCWLPVRQAWQCPELVTSGVSIMVSSAGSSGVSMMGPKDSYWWCQNSWARKPVVDAGTFKNNVFLSVQRCMEHPAIEELVLQICLWSYQHPTGLIADWCLSENRVQYMTAKYTQHTHTAGYN